MDKETLSHYGWIVILVLILSVLLALATPFGTFVADGFKATYTGLFDVETSVMDIVMDSTGGCAHTNAEIKNVTDDYTGDTVCDKCGTVLEEGKHIIPEGGIYYVGVTGSKVGNYSGYTAKYGPGEEFPAINNGDVYVTQEYEYRYNYHVIEPTAGGNAYWSSNESQNGWGVRYIGNSTTPGLILSEINTQPITSLRCTYGRHHTIVSSSVIPTSVTNMDYTYQFCWKLKTLPEIPEGVVSMYGTFLSCSGIETYVGSTEPNGHFENYKLPVSLTNMSETFYYTNIIVAPDLSRCSNLRNMFETFRGCSKLTTIKVIPESVGGMAGTFWNCKMLTGTIEINAKNTTTYWTFDEVDFETQQLTLSGSSPYIDSLGSTGKNYCKECNGQHLLLVGEHNCHGGTATCTDLAKCIICNQEYGNLASHTGGTSSCSELAKCDSCKNEYGTLKPHLVHNGTCTVCGAESAIESEHSPYSNNISSVTLGTWDYSDAQSVTITITYQTESTSCDWIYLKSGENYINLNGDITSTATKIGGTTKTTKTFTTTALTGSVIFRTDGSRNNYYGVYVSIMPNY